MKETNYSITGDHSNSIKILHKIGVVLFLIGLILLINGFTFELFFSETQSRIASFGFMFFGAILFTYESRKQFRLISLYFKTTNATQKAGLFFSLIGLSILFIAWFGKILNPSWLYLILSLLTMAIGILLYTYSSYSIAGAGIKNNFVYTNSLTARGIIGWTIGVLLTIFYIQLYWFSSTLKSLINLFNPLSELFRGIKADQWFVYGTLYTFLILFLGIKFMVKYRHNQYQLIRTVSVIISQVVFAYFIPTILEALSFNSATDSTGKYLGYYSGNLVNVWPLNYSFFEDGTLNAYTQEAYQPIGMTFLVWGIILFLVITPFVTYLVGKRWYCSWLCGCGGLAETAGDSFRQLSSKSTTSWKIEKGLIYSIMVFILVMTIASLLPYFTGKEFVVGFVSIRKLEFYVIATFVLFLSSIGLFLGYKKYKNKFLFIGSLIFIFLMFLLTLAYFSGNENVFAIKSTVLKKTYGFFIGSVFSGIIGVGFYPILGNRVWCRFGCPMAGYMGLFQRFKSRFRITTNGGQCISCGNCSTYCEQGIDVRAYAQKGENIVRASCVGCGICSAVCPRGVLKLENGPEDGRITNSNFQQ